MKWFATDDGVSAFDGVNWTCYTEDDGLASNGVTSIAVEPTAPSGLVQQNPECHGYLLIRLSIARTSRIPQYN